MRNPGHIAVLAAGILLCAARPAPGADSKPDLPSPDAFDAAVRPKTAVILVLPAPGASGPLRSTFSGSLDWTFPLTGDGGGGASVALWWEIPKGPVRLAAFIDSGGYLGARASVVERTFTDDSSGEPITFVERVRIEETRIEPALAAGFGAAFSLPVASRWFLEARLGAGPAWRADRAGAILAAVVSAGWKGAGITVALQAGACRWWAGKDATRGRIGLAVGTSF